MRFNVTRFPIVEGVVLSDCMAMVVITARSMRGAVNRLARITGKNWRSNGEGVAVSIDNQQLALISELTH